VISQPCRHFRLAHGCKHTSTARCTASFCSGPTSSRRGSRAKHRATTRCGARPARASTGGRARAARQAATCASRNGASFSLGGMAKDRAARAQARGPIAPAAPARTRRRPRHSRCRAAEVSSPPGQIAFSLDGKTAIVTARYRHRHVDRDPGVSAAPARLRPVAARSSSTSSPWPSRSPTSAGRTLAFAHASGRGPVKGV